MKWGAQKAIAYQSVENEPDAKAVKAVLPELHSVVTANSH
jgi:hypothetical protein